MATNTQTVGNMVVNLLMDDRDFTKQTKTAAGRLRLFGQQITSVARTLDRTLTTALVAATTAMVGLGTAAGVVGAKFEKTMSEVAAVSGAGVEDLKRLTDEARRIGAETNFTATQAAEAMVQLARAGFDSQQILAATSDIIALAGANNFDLARSAEVTAATLKQFGLSAEDTGRVVDVFTRVNQKSLFSMESLAEAMKFAGTVGRGMGFSIEETTAAIAQFRDLGLEGSMVGTNFRFAMLELARGSDKAREALAKYGLTVEDVNPQVVGFAESMTKLGEAGVSVTDMMQIVGTRAGANVALIASKFAEGSATFNEVFEDLRMSAGRAELTYQRMIDNVSGQFDLLKSAAQEALLTIFERFRGPLQAFFTGMANGISRAARSFQLLNGEANDTEASLQAITDRVEGFVDAIARMLPQLELAGQLMVGAFVAVRGVLLVSQLTSLASGVAQFGAALVAALGPAGALAAAVVGVAGLVAALVGLTDAMEDAQRASDAIAGSQRAQDRMAAQLARRTEELSDIVAEANQRATDTLQSTEELSDAEADRLRFMQALTAEQAAQMEQEGRLLVMQRNIIDLRTLARDAGQDAFTITEQRIGQIDEEVGALRDLDTQLQEQIALIQRLDAISTGRGFANFRLAAAALEQQTGIVVETFEDLQTEASHVRLRIEQLEEQKRNLTNETTNLVRESRKEADIAQRVADNMIAADAAIRGVGEASDETADKAAELAKILERVSAGPSDEAQRQAALAELELETREALVESLLERHRIEQRIAQIVADRNRELAEEEAIVNEIARRRKEEQEREDRRRSVGGRLRALLRLPADEQERLERKARRANFRLEWQESIFRSMGRTITRELQDAIDGVFRSMVRLGEGAMGRIRDVADAMIGPFNDIIGLALDAAGSVADTTGEIRDLREQADTVEARAAEESAALEAAGQYHEAAQALVDAAEEAKQLREQADDIESDPNRQATSFIDQALESALTFVDALVQNLPTFINQIIDAIPQLVDGLVAAIPRIIIAVADRIPGLIDMLIEQIPRVVQALVDSVPRLIQSLVEGIPRLVESLVAQIPTVIEAIGAQLPSIIAMVADVIVTLIGAIPDIVAALLAEIPGIIRAVVAQIPKLLQALFKAIPEVIVAVVKAIPDIVLAIIDAIPDIVTSVVEAIPTLIEGIIGAIPTIITSLVERLPEIVTALVMLIPQVVTAIIVAIPDIIMAVIRGIPDIIVAVVAAIPDIVFGLIQAIPDIITAFVVEFIPAMVSAAGELVKELGEFLKEIGEKIAEAFLEVLRFFNFREIFRQSDDPGRNDKTGVAGFFQDVGRTIGNLFRRPENRLQSGLDSVPRTMTTVLEPGEGVLNRFDNARRLAQKMGAGGTFGTEFMPPAPGIGNAGGASGFGRSILEVLVMLDSRVVDAQLFDAVDSGNAPATRAALQRAATGVQTGFNRGNFNPWV